MTETLEPPTAVVADSVIAIVGGGPRCLGVLDSLCANVSELPPGHAKVVVHIFDPFPIGGGRVWRRDQPSLLWMNVPASGVTVFADETCHVAGRLRKGPTLAEWIDEHRASLLADPELAEEAATASGETFVSRGLQSEYLKWAFEHIVSTAPEHIVVVTHQDTVIDIVDVPGPAQLVRTESMEAVRADKVVLAQGHLDDELGRREEVLRDFAVAHDLLYMPPAYTADCDASQVPAGGSVIVSGLGLAFIDWMVLLGESRGGTFTADSNGRLRYHPSGKEPVLYAGSRRGVPYHPKLTSPLRAERPPLPHFFDVPTVLERYPDPRTADFATELWPLACKEILYAHYHELFHGHPELVSMEWTAFLRELTAVDHGSAELTDLVERAVPDPRDRFDMAAIQAPLSGTGLAGLDDTHRYVTDFVRAHLARIDDPRCSVDSAVALGFFSVYDIFGKLLRARRLSASSIVRDVDGWLHGLFSHVTSGPPPERLAQLAAMADAGVVVFLGGGLRVSVDAQAGVFRATSDTADQEISARCLIDARLPPADITRTVDPLLRSLKARDEVSDSISGVSSGRILVDSSGRLIGADGQAHPARWAVGPWVIGSGWAHAFPRPRQNAGFFRQNDMLARDLLQLPLTDTREPGSRRQ
ncbi:FAD/NAD(P)-binding protein [Streptomyces malaysiensis]|uniref:NAD binding domain containing protein n=1 Tax=Streptomyces malaysiensis TaxID=92644 RepID=A0A7X5WWF0_STRMQ|nr:FAD/NAD(P)-binding protein [Streptomyces malaysiensis]NIY62262.1 NAD binding domain containing protein [Streptomyces malaysiensis]